MDEAEFFLKNVEDMTLDELMQAIAVLNAELEGKKIEEGMDTD